MKSKCTYTYLPMSTYLHMSGVVQKQAYVQLFAQDAPLGDFLL